MSQPRMTSSRPSQKLKLLELSMTAPASFQLSLYQTVTSEPSSAVNESALPVTMLINCTPI